MKKLFFYLVLTTSLFGQAKLTVNPGIKFGLAFGEKVQFIFGYEISFVMYRLDPKDEHRAGIVIDYDWIDNVDRLHLGVEYMYRVFGVDVGPTFGWQNSKLHYGFSVIPFGGAGIVPYLNYTYIKGINHYFDFGSYIKMPIPLSKEKFNVGG